MRLAALDADVVILARGGDSAVRLPYDTELVARAVASCPVPVIAAVGHSADNSLTGEVAWRSVPTPSAAGGLVKSLMADADRQAVELGREIAALARRHLDKARRDLDRLDDGMAHSLLSLLARSPTLRRRWQYRQLGPGGSRWPWSLRPCSARWLYW